MAIRKGFPDSWGNKRVTVIEMVGPASYVQYTAPTTGGQDVQVDPAGGVKTIDWAAGSVTQDGLHRAEVVQIEASTLRGVSLGDTQLVLKWYVVATGAEVAAAVDLSAAAKTIRLLVVGDK